MHNYWLGWITKGTNPSLCILRNCKQSFKLQNMDPFQVPHLFVWLFVLSFSFKKNFIVVDSQYCISFRYTAKWIGYTYIHSFFKFFSYAGPSAYAGGETPWKADRLISVSVGLRQ